jgi:ABC-type polysaccharide/polyol phosphate transport system ATPase subunit
VIAIRLQGVGRYFGPHVEIDGPEKPRESFATLLRIAGFNPRPVAENPKIRRTVAATGHVLRDITLDVEQGSVVCLAGPSGAGKTVLLQILAGVIAPTSGRVEIYAPVRRLVSQGADLDERLTALENICSSDGFPRAPMEEGERYVAEVIDFAELRGFEDAPLRTYSTGMLMRLGVAMALCGRPSIVLIDDVLNVGDIGFQAKCVDRVHVLKEQGCTLVVAFSDETLMHEIATRVITLGGGHVVSDTPGAQWIQARESSSAADVDWQLLRSLPEDDVMRVRSIDVDAGEEGQQHHIDLSLGLEAKVGPVRCRPSVFLMRDRIVVFRTVCPEFLELERPQIFGCRVRIPTSLLSNGCYTMTISVITLEGQLEFSIKWEGAVTLTVRRPETQPDAGTPILALRLPWEIERLAGAFTEVTA